MPSFPDNIEEDDIEVVQLFASKIHYSILRPFGEIPVSLHYEKVQAEVSD